MVEQRNLFSKLFATLSVYMMSLTMVFLTGLCDITFLKQDCNKAILVGAITALSLSSLSSSSLDKA